MLRTYRLMSAVIPAVLAAVCAGAAARAADATPINGALSAVVEGAYDGSAGTLLSFVRFFNGAATPHAFTVRVIGAQSGQVYGQAVSVQIPQNAAVQYSVAQLIGLANATPSSSDTSYAVYIQNPDATAGYQHVTYDTAHQYFENASICSNGLLPAATLANNSNIVVTNVHTTAMAGGAFPSRLEFHNYAATAATVKVAIIDAGLLGADGVTISAGAGSVMGQTTIAIPANTTVVKSFATLQTAAGWTPSAAQAYANVVVSDAAGGAPAVVVAHVVRNVALGGDINMSNTCAVGKPTAGVASYKGTLAGPNGQSGTFAAAVPTATAATASAASAKIKAAAVQTGTPTTGTLMLDGNTVTLSGTYDSSTNTVNLSGNGYTFVGTVKDGVYDGDYTGPHGSGAFSTLNTTQKGVVTAYCGTYDEPRPPGEATARAGGVFNLNIAANGTISGDTSSTYGSGYHYGLFSGHAEGAIAYVTHKSANGDPANTDDVIGHISNGTISGTYDAAGGPGTFSGSICQVPAS